MTEDRKQELMARRFALGQRVRDLGDTIELASITEPSEWEAIKDGLLGCTMEVAAIQDGIETAP